MAAQSITLMDGKLHVYRRDNTPFWQCSTYLSGRNHRATTKESELLRAEEFARGWFAERLVDDRRRRRGELSDAQVAQAARTEKRRVRKTKGPTFREAADLFQTQFAWITGGERSQRYVSAHDDRLKLHLLPYFGDKPVSEITSGDVTAYRVQRKQFGLSRKGRVELKRREQEGYDPEKIMDGLERPARSTLHQEIVCLRQVLKTARREGWIDHLPDLSEPYRKSPKVSHRAWFSPEEYKILYKATRDRAAKPLKERWRVQCENLHDFVLFMVNTGLRPDEALGLQYRDVKVVTDRATNQRILEIEVRGKRGTGYCKSMPGAVLPFQRIQKRNNGMALDPIFPKLPSQLFARVLADLRMKEDREGSPRTIYSLRHTYISLRLIEGADIYQVAKNCRTSVEMIEKHYAVHIKDRLDAAAINVRKPRSLRPEAAEKPPAKPKPKARAPISRLAKRGQGD